MTAVRRRLAPDLALPLALAALLLAALLAAVATPAGAATARATRDFPDFPASCRDQVSSKICRVTRFPGRPFLVLWGDSHALQYLVPVRQVAQRRKVNAVVIYSGGCPLSLPFPRSSGEPRMTCDTHNERALAYVRDLAAEHRVRLVLGSWWHYYRVKHAELVEEAETGVDSGMSTYERHIARLGVERSAAMFAAIGRAGIPADVLAQAGTVPDGAPACPEGEEPYVCDLPRSQVLPRAWDNRRWLRELSTRLARRPRVVDPSPRYCDATTCHGRVDGANTFFDQAHLGKRLTYRMRAYFRPSFDALARQRP